MQKLAIFCLFISFFFCYLEWGKEESAFVYEIAYQVLFRTGDKVNTFSHPLVLLPFLGQLTVLVALFLKPPKKWMVITGVALMGTLVLMVLTAGALSQNWKIVLSTVPFTGSAVWSIWSFKKKAVEG